MSLQKIKDLFESKTVGGHDIDILAYDERIDSSIIGIICLEGDWILRSWPTSGITHSSIKEFNLVEKNKG